MLGAYNMMMAATMGNGHSLALLICLLFAGVVWLQSPASLEKLTVKPSVRV
jgi:hypothetical protein